MSRVRVMVVAGLGVLIAGALLLSFAGVEGTTEDSVASQTQLPASPTAVPQRTESPGAGSDAAGSPEEKTTRILTRSQLQEVERRWGDTVSLAVAPLDSGKVVKVKGSAVQYAWSTSKILVVAQVLEDVGGPKHLDDWLRQNITAALSWSDNDAAWYLHNSIKSQHGGTQPAARAMTKLIRRSGDKTTKILPDWTEATLIGLTRWQPEDQAVFFRDLVRGCVLGKKSAKFLIDQMGNVVPEQSWGLGTIGSSAFKGGWASSEDGEQLTRQVGLVSAADGTPYVAAISVSPPSGLAEDGVELIDEVAEWLAGEVDSAPELDRC